MGAFRITYMCSFLLGADSFCLRKRIAISDGNNQLVSYDYVILYRNITNLIIIAPGDYVT